MACREPAPSLPRVPDPVPRQSRNGADVIRAGHAPSRLYNPAGHSPAPIMRSPDYVQMSTAAANTLGLVPGRLYRCSCTRCLNLLLTYPEGCRANCAYCGLARHREASRAYADRNFIRVDWPAARLEDVIDRIAEQGESSPFQRMCISMITHPRSDEDAKRVLERWTARIPRARIPVSILSNPTTMTRADVASLHALGAEIFTVALDAANADVFATTRGRGVASPHAWETYWEIFHHAVDLFGPERTGMHLVVGLGETDRDILSVCRTLRKYRSHSHLFSFFPERGSLMDHLPAPPRARWRRLQLARYLIEYRGHDFDALEFDGDGNLSGFGLDADLLDAVIVTGLPFRTSGCPGAERADVSACDRPYGDSPPSDIASYPFQPESHDLTVIRRQLGLAP